MLDNWRVLASNSVFQLQLVTYQYHFHLHLLQQDPGVMQFCFLSDMKGIIMQVHSRDVKRRLEGTS